jgi:phosphatidate cytidylyltransferase
MDAALRKRLSSAALFLPIVAVLAWLGPWTFAALLTVIVVAGGWELSGLLRRLGWRAPRFLPFAAAVLFVASLAGWFGPTLLPVTVLVWGIPLLWLFRPGTPPSVRRGGEAWSIHLLAAAYLGLLLAFLARLEAGPWSPELLRNQGSRRVFYALFVTWACDTGAYVVGRLWGRRLLWPSVSPKKTWEGAFGGFVWAVAAGAFLAPPFAGCGRMTGLLLGALAGVLAQFGDLIESRLKRKAEVKDSGTLIPGHGGLLDRLDSLLFAAPLFYYGLNSLSR